MSRTYVNLDQFRKMLGEPNPEIIMRAGEDSPVKDVVVMAPLIPSSIRALGDAQSRLIEFVITDETIDRYSDIVKADGWDVSDYENNPVVLWAHSHYDPPVGKSVSLDVLKKQKQIRSVTEFTPRDLNPFGYMIYEMYRQKFMNAVSVGFLPREWTWVSHDTDAERSRRGGIDYLKQSLLEYSAVPVPANPNALQLAASKGIDTAPMKAWAERILDEGNVTEDVRKHVELLRTASSPVGRSLFVELTDIKSHFPQEEPVKSKVKRIERFACGTDGCVHDSEADALKCIEQSEHRAALGATVRTMLIEGKSFDEIKAAITKAGRVLSKKNESALRKATEQLTAATESLATVLAQLDKQEDDEEDDEEDEDKSVSTAVLKTIEPDAVEDGTIMMDEAVLTAAIKSAISDTVSRLGGRVD